MLGPRGYDFSDMILAAISAIDRQRWRRLGDSVSYAGHFNGL